MSNSKENIYVLSSDNEGKIREFNSMLNEYGVTIYNKSHELIRANNFEVIEDQDTLVGNSSKKSRELFKYLNGNYNVIADDSGLFVEQLNGAPGVLSARMFKDYNYGRNDNEKLMHMLNNELIKKGLNYKCLENRKAYFKIVLSLQTIEGNEYLFEGKVDGYIALSESGNNGFAYDKIFIPNQYLSEEKTFADLSDFKKNQISHRNIAINKFINFIEQNK